jgi:pimeloyl-ACP methyl ester carboxylesterase
MWVSVPWDSVPKPIRPATWVTTLALGLVDSIKVKYPIDTTRVYVVGGSMGGVGAVYFPEYRPPLFAASVGVAAGGDTTSSVVRTVMTMGWWLFHGAIDNVIPVAGSREFVKKARALLYADGKDTANIRYTEYPTGAHDIWDQSFYNLPMHQWLFLQKRNASASRVNNDLRPCLQSRDQGLSFVARFFSSPTLVLVPVQGAAPAYTLSGRAVSVGQVRSLVH